MAGIEVTVMLQFAMAMDRAARERDLIVRPLPLNAQDRDAAGDIIFSDETRYSLIEMKSYEKNLEDEAAKPRRKVLCQLLCVEPEMIALHDRAHFAAWSLGHSIQINIYRNEVCTQSVFSGELSLPIGSNRESRFSIEEYQRSFFDTTTVSLPLGEFGSYLEWVMLHTSGSGSSTVQVHALDHKSKEFHMVGFDSLDEAHEWFSRQRPTNDNSDGMAGP